MVIHMHVFAGFFIGVVKRQKVAKQRQQRLRRCMHSHCIPQFTDRDSSRTRKDNYKRFLALGRNVHLDIKLSAQFKENPLLGNAK
jgi:hypothetical protein